MERDYQLLKDVLSVPTVTYQEDRMVEFLIDWLEKNGIPFNVDEYNNIYAIKQTDEDVEYFPCVIAHTDTVHNIETINIREEMLQNSQYEIKPALKAYNDLGNPTGIGGDDKCGVYACLELLKELPNLKAAFFVSEETGCHGSKKADPNFFMRMSDMVSNLTLRVIEWLQKFVWGQDYLKEIVSFLKLVMVC
jgi:tripeptide aminopeptidase